MPLSRERIAELQRLRADLLRAELAGTVPHSAVTQMASLLKYAVLEDVDELLAAAERDCDLRVLDEWARRRRNKKVSYQMRFIFGEGRMEWECLLLEPGKKAKIFSADNESGTSPDASRHAAAQAIEKERET